MLLLLTLVVACDLTAASTPTGAIEPTLAATPTQGIEPPSTAPPTEQAPAPNPSPTSLETAAPPVKLTKPTLLPEVKSWYAPGAKLLFVRSDDVQADLLAHHEDGTVQIVLPDVGNETTVSSDGRWLGYVRWRDDGGSVLELHNVESGARREIIPDTTSGLFRFVFDPEIRRLAYIDLGGYTDVGVPWALVIVELDGEATARYDALMAGPEPRPLPGAPVGWLRATSGGDELLIDTFLPYTEGAWMGLWGVTLPAQGGSAPLDSLALRELIPGAPAYSSELYLAPDAQSVAYLARDRDYVPDDYLSEFYDLAVNRMDLASLAGGSRSTLVKADDGSALARALAWSPTGERLLFGQGRYEGENFANLALKSSDLSGRVVTYGPLSLPALGGLLDLAWCDASQAYYVIWDGSDGTEYLIGFDLNTGVSTEISSGRRIEMVGCAPR
jgi:hypothetical protein